MHACTVPVQFAIPRSVLPGFYLRSFAILYAMTAIGWATFIPRVMLLWKKNAQEWLLQYYLLKGREEFAFAMDDDNRVVDINEGLLGHLGYAANSILNKDVLSFVHSDDRLTAERLLQVLRRKRREKIATLPTTMQLGLVQRPPRPHRGTTGRNVTIAADAQQEDGPQHRRGSSEYGGHDHAAATGVEMTNVNDNNIINRMRRRRSDNQRIVRSGNGHLILAGDISQMPPPPTTLAHLKEDMEKSQSRTAHGSHGSSGSHAGSAHPSSHNVLAGTNIPSVPMPASTTAGVATNPIVADIQNQAGLLTSLSPLFLMRAVRNRMQANGEPEPAAVAENVPNNAESEKSSVVLSDEDCGVVLERDTADETIALCQGRLRRYGTGTWLWFSWRATALMNRGTILVRLYDITKEKEEALELKRKEEEARASGAAKAVFLANMSHEIRTPINGVVGMARFLAETALNDEQREYVSTITTCSEHLLTVINDILDYSKIDSGNLTLEKRPLEIHRLIEDALDLSVTRAKLRTIDVAYLMGKRVPWHMIGDVTRLRQILVNLLSNALKFTKSGEVVVTVDVDPSCTDWVLPPVYDPNAPLPQLAPPALPPPMISLSSSSQVTQSPPEGVSVSTSPLSVTTSTPASSHHLATSFATMGSPSVTSPTVHFLPTLPTITSSMSSISHNAPSHRQSNLTTPLSTPLSTPLYNTHQYQALDWPPSPHQGSMTDTPQRHHSVELSADEVAAVRGQLQPDTVHIHNNTGNANKSSLMSSPVRPPRLLVPTYPNHGFDSSPLSVPNIFGDTHNYTHSAEPSPIPLSAASKLATASSSSPFVDLVSASTASRTSSHTRASPVTSSSSSAEHSPSVTPPNSLTPVHGARSIGSSSSATCGSIPALIPAALNQPFTLGELPIAIPPVVASSISVGKGVMVPGTTALISSTLSSSAPSSTTTTPSTSTRTLATATADIPCTPRPVVLRFAVRDTGIGIPLDKQDRLFRVFSQVDTSTTREFGGTGLGLAISYKLVKLMGGQIWVSSEPGKGSTFHFTLQTNAPDPLPQSIVPSTVVPEMKETRVLLLADMHSPLRYMAAACRRWGALPCSTTDISHLFALLQSKWGADKRKPMVRERNVNTATAGTHIATPTPTRRTLLRGGANEIKPQIDATTVATTNAPSDNTAQQDHADAAPLPSQAHAPPPFASVDFSTLTSSTSAPHASLVTTPSYDTMPVSRHAPSSTSSAATSRSAMTASILTPGPLPSIAGSPPGSPALSAGRLTPERMADVDQRGLGRVTIAAADIARRKATSPPPASAAQSADNKASRSGLTVDSVSIDIKNGESRGESKSPLPVAAMDEKRSGPTINTTSNGPRVSASNPNQLSSDSTHPTPPSPALGHPVDTPIDIDPVPMIAPEQILNELAALNVAFVDSRITGVDSVRLCQLLRLHHPALRVVLLCSEDDEMKTRGSKIQATPKPVKMSTFFQLLRPPDNDSYAKRESTTSQPSQLLSTTYPIRFLLAEDNAINKKVFFRLMTRLGYNEGPSIDTADNGAIAVQMFKQALLTHVNAAAGAVSPHGVGVASTGAAAANDFNAASTATPIDTRQYHIIFMDMQMPEMDGIQASKLIRQHQKMLQLPPVLQPVIIAMTANAMESDRDKCIAAGMDDYISKPISFKGVQQKIEEWAKRIMALQSEASTAPQSQSSHM